MLKIYLKKYLYLLILILGLGIITSILNYIIPSNSSILKLIVPPISIFISCVLLGKDCKQKAYLEGIKFSGVYLLITTIFKIIINSPFTYKTVIIYVLIIIVVVYLMTTLR